MTVVIINLWVRINNEALQVKCFFMEITTASVCLSACFCSITQYILFLCCYSTMPIILMSQPIKFSMFHKNGTQFILFLCSYSTMPIILMSQPIKFSMFHKNEWVQLNICNCFWLSVQIESRNPFCMLKLNFVDNSTVSANKLSMFH
jgi:hypothetical protein